MKHFRKIKKALIILCTVFLLFALLFVCSTALDYGGIYEKTVRLHVLAHSDDPQAQQLKLQVRDDLLVLLDEALADCKDKKQAQRRLEELLPVLQARAEKTLAEHGCPEQVTVTLSVEEYPTRVYDHCTYPAGSYTSLRVLIGEGQGQNWWCVVYPPLCLSASDASGGGYTEEEQALLEGETEGYRLKFALLEWGSRLVKRLRGR